MLGAVQHRLRPLPQLQGGQDRHLPERQPRPARARPTATSTWAAGSAARPSTCMVPYADLNLLKFPDRDQAMEKILDLTMLSDIFPTGYHGASPPASTLGLDGLRRRRRTGRPGRRALGAAARRGGRHRRRPEPRAAGAGAQLRLRDGRRLQGRPQGPDRADPRRARGRLRRRRRRLRGPRPRRATSATRRRPRCSTRSWTSPAPAARSASPASTSPAIPGGVDDAAKDRLAVDPDRPRLGQVAHASPPASAR